MMRLAELAFLLDVEPKWVLNTLAALGRTPRYTLALARRLAVTRAIIAATGATVARAFDLAEQALRDRSDAKAPVVVPGEEAEAGVWINLPRILSSLNIRLSLLRTMFAPRQRGRPAARRRDPLRAAREWGIDLTLLADNARKSQEQRLRQLDAMVRFARGAQRVAPKE